MLALGRAKLGWLKAFEIAVVKVNLKRSVRSNVLEIEAFCMLYPGPSSTFPPEFPNRPCGGGTKHDESNQRLMLRRSDGRLPLQIRSGRPPKLFVLEGSGLEKPG